MRESPSRLLAAMQSVMGPLPSRDHRVPLELEVIEEHVGKQVTRKKVAFQTEPGDPLRLCEIRAWVLIPTRLSNPAPAMLCLHQTTSAGKDQPAGLSPLSHDTPDLAYAAELAERGFVTISPDYPGFGEAHRVAYGRGYASTTIKGIWNHMLAVDAIQSLPAVDPRKIGVIGHSLGGHNALFVAAFDPRLRAVITSCGFTSFARYRHGELSPWSLDQYMPRVATQFGNDPARMPFDFGDVLAALTPRMVLINAPIDDDNFDPAGVDECVAKARSSHPGHDTPSRIRVEHPKAGHRFPDAVRMAFYEELARFWQD